MRILTIPHTLNALLICSWYAPSVAASEFFPLRTGTSEWYENGRKNAFLDELVASMTIPELVLQLHIMFADDIVGANSTNELYDHATRFTPEAGVGIIHDWYSLNKSHYNSVQTLNSEKSRLKIPFMQFGECLHGVGSFKQSMFPQSIGLAASFDTDMVYRVGRAIGSEARAIGIHACFSPVLDLGLEPRWGRVQEAWGEDTLLTSHMGVAMASGLSKNGSWSDPDAIVPVMKHFAGHGSSQGGINGAPAQVRGMRHVLMNMLRPFKAVVDLGGVRGVMMAYHELDDIPAHVNPMLYDALSEWGFNGFVTADDAGLAMLYMRHNISSSPADTIAQWFNAGGMIQYYNFPLDVFLNATIDLVSTGKVERSTIESHVRKILDVKYDLGLFRNPYIPEDIEVESLTTAHAPLVLEAAHKSIVLLENRNHTLPLKPSQQGISNIALIGPFGDTLNYGDYSGQWGSTPSENSSTLREAMSSFLAINNPNVLLTSSWGANTWHYNAQHNIPAYLLSHNGVHGGLLATYYADPNFTEAIFQKQEMPNRDWGLYPPPGLPSNNFSVVWEGDVLSPTEFQVDGWIGVAVSADVTANLYIDDTLIVKSSQSLESTIMSNIEPLSFSVHNGTQAPAGGIPFKFSPGASHKVRLELQFWNHEKSDDKHGVNAQVQLFWNLVDQNNSIQQAVDLATKSDVIVLAVGANWNSDGEGGDRSTLGLSINQTELADAIFSLGQPVVLVLQGGRPFAIPEYYARASAVISAFFPGPAGGQAISDVLFGKINPGGRVPISVPSSEGALPSAYSFKNTAHFREYLDADWLPTYSFGHGLSYTTFESTNFTAVSTSSTLTFSETDTITFFVTIKNTGSVAGSHVAQVYLLARVSQIAQPVIQLVAFNRVYLEPGETKTIGMDLEVDRYLPILDRRYQWLLEKGPYKFALMDHSGWDAIKSDIVTMECV